MGAAEKKKGASQRRKVSSSQTTKSVARRRGVVEADNPLIATDTPEAPKPEIVILVGGNGSGKTTYYNTFLAESGLPFINADIIAKKQFGDRAEARSADAAKMAEDTRNRLLDARESFCFETVFSHVSKVDFLVQAKAVGYTIKMVAIYTASEDLNVARVAQRVGEGGHSVPEEKIRERIPRTYLHIGAALEHCDEFVLLDNSSFETPYVVKLVKKGDDFVTLNGDLPDFAAGWGI